MATAPADRVTADPPTLGRPARSARPRLPRPRGLRACVWALAVIGAGLLIISETSAVNVFAAPLVPATARVAPADVAVVLAGGQYEDGSLNQSSMERTVTAVRLYHRGLAPRLLFSGGPCCGRSAGARMAALATELGVPGSAILLEEQSVRTHENAQHSAVLLRSGGLRSVILVTSPVHLRRAVLCFAAAGVAVQPVSASETDLSLVSGTDERITLLDAALHEYVGLAYYRLRGWI